MENKLKNIGDFFKKNTLKAITRITGTMGQKVAVWGTAFAASGGMIAGGGLLGGAAAYTMTNGSGVGTIIGAGIGINAGMLGISKAAELGIIAGEKMNRLHDSAEDELYRLG
jgi:hypothetical protein